MFSHVDNTNNPTMVDVSEKKETRRIAHAKGYVKLTKEIMRNFKDGEISSKKGPVFQTAIIAGTMGVKKTSDLIPFCHQLNIDSIKFEINKVDEERVSIDCKTINSGKTGVEMEALTGVNIAALTIYDMCKALSHDIEIEQIFLVEKSGGKSDYKTKN